MGFKLLILKSGQEGTEYVDSWAQKLREINPDIQVNLAGSTGEAMEIIEEVDAAFGNIAPDLLARAKNLKWIACPQLLRL